MSRSPLRAVWKGRVMVDTLVASREAPALWADWRADWKPVLRDEVLPPLFVVYTEDRDTDLMMPLRGTALRNRGFVVKINRLFRF